MPFNIKKTTMRTIDPHNEDQLSELSKADDLPLDQYLQQFPPQTMVAMFEPEFTDKKFLNWAYDKINNEHPECNFRYAIIDHEFTPDDPGGKTLSFPFTFIGLFDYKGHTYAGSFVGGHIANFLEVKGNGHPDEFINLEEPYRNLFTADTQQKLFLQSMEALQNYPGIDGIVAAVPNRRAGDTPDLGKSSFYNLMLGGHVTDRYKSNLIPESFNDPNSDNPLKAKCTSFVDLVSKEKKNAYTFFSLLGNDAETLLSDREFCKICCDIRNLGPEYQEITGRKEGTKYDSNKGRNIVKSYVDLGTGKNALITTR